MRSLQRRNTRTSDDMRQALFGCFRGKYLGTLFVEIKHRHERNVGLSKEPVQPHATNKNNVRQQNSMLAIHRIITLAQLISKSD